MQQLEGSPFKFNAVKEVVFILSKKNWLKGEHSYALAWKHCMRYLCCQEYWLLSASCAADLTINSTDKDEI